MRPMEKMDEFQENDDILKAREFARCKHQDQKDCDGANYFTDHICQVVDILKCVTWDTETLMCGYLHDTIEDTNTSYQELEISFGKKVADMVMEVTHEGKKDQHGYYFPRLHTHEAIMVKFADRLSNLSRIFSWEKERKEQYLRRSKFWKSNPPE